MRGIAGMTFFEYVAFEHKHMGADMSKSVIIRPGQPTIIRDTTAMEPPRAKPVTHESEELKRCANGAAMFEQRPNPITKEQWAESDRRMLEVHPDAETRIDIELGKMGMLE